MIPRGTIVHDKARGRCRLSQYASGEGVSARSGWRAVGRGPSDDEACWGSKPFPHDWAAPIRAADRQYHGDYYRA